MKPTICNDSEKYIFSNTGFENYAWSTDEKSRGVGIYFHGQCKVSTSFNRNNSVINEANIGNVFSTPNTMNN